GDFDQKPRRLPVVALGFGRRIVLEKHGGTSSVWERQRDHGPHACGSTARMRNGLSADRLPPDRGDRLVELGRRDRPADRALSRPMGARADRLDPRAWMGMSNQAVGFETESVERVPEPPVDELQKSEL